MGATRWEGQSITALIPAAGRARRLGELPVSKELLPVGFDGSPEAPRPRLAYQGLLAGLERAGVDRTLWIVRRDKTDILRHLASRPVGSPGDGSALPTAHVVLDDSGSLPETLRHGLAFAPRDTVVLGFPDILFRPRDAFTPLLQDHRRSGADLTLGLFPTPPERRPTTDMVRLSEDGRVLGIEVRPEDSDLLYNWLLAVWEPSVSAALLGSRPAPGTRRREPQLGDLFEALRRDGLTVRGVPFPNGSYRDLGTPGIWIRTLGECDSGSWK